MCILTGILALTTSIATTLGTSIAAGVGTSVTTAVATGIGVATMAVAEIAIGGAIAGGVMGIVQGVQSAEAQRTQAEFQAEQAAENARLAYRHAENIELAADQKRAALLRETLQKRGSGRAGYAANGVVLGSGSSAEYEADIANAYDLDLRNLNYDVANDAWQAKVQGTNNANSAALLRAEADAYGTKKTTSLIGGIMNTIGSTTKTTFNVATGLKSFV